MIEGIAGITFIIALIVGGILGCLMFLPLTAIWMIFIMPHVIICHALEVNTDCSAELFDVSSQKVWIWMVGPE